MTTHGKHEVKHAKKSSASREERLAEQLRANLRKRKSQARALGNSAADSDDSNSNHPSQSGSE